jgi:hypothetical protein
MTPSAPTDCNLLEADVVAFGERHTKRTLSG